MSMTPYECPLHGVGVDPARLVGRRVRQVVAAWHRFDGQYTAEPIDVWLIDDLDEVFHLTTGADWCLMVDDHAPHSGYDMDVYGVVEVAPWTRGSPFVPHAGEPVTAVHERFDADTGRIGLKIVFPTGSVTYGGWRGDLHLVDRSPK